MKKRKRIGEALLLAGLITDEQLKNALEIQKGKKKRLGKVLIEIGYATDLQIAETLSKQLHFPLVRSIDSDPGPDILKLVPREVAAKKLILPYHNDGRTLQVLMANPLDWETIENLAFSTGLKVSVAVTPESCLLKALEKFYGPEEKHWDLMRETPTYEGVEFQRSAREIDEKMDVDSLYKQSEASPIVKLVTMIIVDAIKMRSSDIHVEPMEKHVLVRYRVDGELRTGLKYPLHMHDSVVSRMKILSNLDITIRRLSQDGRTTVQVDGEPFDMRVSTLPSVRGEKIVMRLLNESGGIISLSQLGIRTHILRTLIKLINQPQGMLLITGPTGSGKTTSLYAILQQLQTDMENIVTIEDPVEYKLQNVTQVGINDSIGLTFATVLRSILRQDPDIIMVGEIRDRDTADIAMRAALTGHFVLSTLHTNDTVSTISRLSDIGVEPHLITSSVIGIVAQRLVRKICDACKVETTLPEELQSWKLPFISTVYKGEGCHHCQHTGYRGRVGVYELLVIDQKLKRLIAQRAPEEDLWRVARENGTIPLIEDAWAKVEAGITTVDEIISKIPTGDRLHEGRAENTRSLLELRGNDRVSDPLDIRWQ